MKVAFGISLLSNALLICIAAGLAVLLQERGGLLPRTSPSLDREAFLGLRPGDSCEVVIRAIGYPIAIEALGGSAVDIESHSGSWPEAYVWRYASGGIAERLRASVGIRDCSVVFVSADWGRTPFYVRTEGGLEITKEEMFSHLPARTEE